MLRRSGDIVESVRSAVRAGALDANHLNAGISLFHATTAAWNKAQVKEAQNELAEAAEFYRTILDAQPDNLMARERIGVLETKILSTAREHIRTGQAAEAILLCRGLLKASPDHGELLHILSVAEWNAGNHAEALRLMADVVARFPSDAGARRNLDAAVREITADIRRHSGSGEWLKALKLYGALRRAAPDAAKAIDGDADAAGEAIATATALWRKGHLHKAIETCRKMLEQAPAEVRARDALDQMERTVERLERNLLLLADAGSDSSPIVARLRALYEGDNSGDPFLRVLGEHGVETALTYRQTLVCGLWCAEGFAHVGVAPGQTVQLLLDDPYTTVVAVIGALLLGAVPVVSPPPPPKVSFADYSIGILKIVSAIRPAYILSGDHLAAELSSALGRRVGVVGDFDNASLDLRPSETPCETAFLQIDAGAEGLRRGVRLSEQAVLWQVDRYGEALRLDRQDRIVSGLPLHQTMGLVTSLLLPLLTGTPVTIMAPITWLLRPVLFLQAIADWAGTLAWLPNFALPFLARSIGDDEAQGIDLSSLRGLINASEPVSKASLELFAERFPGVTGLSGRPLKGVLATSYVVAENTFAATFSGFGDEIPMASVDPATLAPGQAVAPGNRDIVSLGRALDGVELRILDGAGRSLPDGWVGEIALRSPSMMTGYLGWEGRQPISDDGFLRTGDFGFLRDGHLYATAAGEGKIHLSGIKLHAHDIEAAVGDIGDVSDGRCVALGIEDDALGTQVLAIVAETALTDASARQTLAQKIVRTVTAQFTVSPHDVLVVDRGWLPDPAAEAGGRELGRDRYLKHRQALAKQTVTKRAAAAPTPAADEQSDEALVRRVLADTIGDQAHEGADSPLLSSGIIDSLDLITVILSLEKAIGRRLPSPGVIGFDAYDTIASIVTVIQSGKTYQAPAKSVISDRQVKVNMYMASDRRFDTIILGSSRVMPMSCRRLSRQGRRAFNFGALAVQMEDIYAIANFALDWNKVPVRTILMGIDPEALSAYTVIDERLLSCPDLMAYLDEDDRKGTGQPGGALPPLEHSSQREVQAAHRSYWLELGHRHWREGAKVDPETGDMLDPEWPGGVDRAATMIDPSKIFESFMLYQAQQGATFHPKRLHYLERLIDLCADARIDLRVFVNPMHPNVYSALQQTTGYIDRVKDLLARLRSFSHPNLSVLDSSLPAGFGGTDGDFLDGRHMGYFNCDRLAEAVLAMKPAR